MQAESAQDDNGARGLGERLLDSHTPQEVQVACFSRNQAFDYLKKANFGRALAHLFVALRLIPSWKQELHGQFSLALREGCKQLSRERRLSETISLMKDALLLYPQEELILMDLGSLFLKLDDFEESLKYYEKALQACPTLLPAYRGIQTIYNKQVERWHFRMLNDVKRNQAFYEAITHRVKEGYCSVLDVGTGTGILSLFAAKSGAHTIWACESNPCMIQTARSVFAANYSSEKISLIGKHSSQISIPVDIPHKVSLLVTEVFDAGLLGEGILTMLLHAWENLLLPPPQLNHQVRDGSAGVVIPFSATIWVAAIQCIHVARRYRQLPNACSCMPTKNTSPLINVESSYYNIGGTRICKICEAPYEEASSQSDDVVYHLEGSSVASDFSEPYTTEDLENVPFGYELLSEPHKVMDINFNNVEELRAFSNGVVKEQLVNLTATVTGSFDAIASWFHLNLDGRTAITTAPFQENGYYRGTCWHQAIYPSSQARRVSYGDRINICLDTQEGVLKVKDSTTVCSENTPALFMLSDTVVAFLNNKTWIKAFQAAATNLLEYFSSNSGGGKKILDLNPFPILGLEILKKSDSSWKLQFKVKTRADKDYILAIARNNSINEGQIQFLTDETFDENIKEECFDVICLNVVDSCGELANDLTDMVTCMVNKLSKNGVMVPWSLTIEGQLIESEKLVNESRVVSNEDLVNFNISEVMNRFAVDYHLDVSYNGLKFKALSNQFELLRLRLDTMQSDSVCGEHVREFSILSTDFGRATGVIYWIHLNLRPGVESISSRCYDSHCSQAVLLTPLHVNPGMAIPLKCLFWYGMLDLKLVDPDS